MKRGGESRCQHDFPVKFTDWLILDFRKPVHRHLALLADNQCGGVIQQLLGRFFLADVVGYGTLELLVGDLVAVEEVFVVEPRQVFLIDRIFRDHLEGALNEIAFSQDVDQRDTVDQLVRLFHDLLFAFAAGKEGRNGRVKEAKDIMETIRQQSVTDREKGMYWRKEYSGYYYRWYEAPIERQALLIEAFTEISPHR